MVWNFCFANGGLNVALQQTEGFERPPAILRPERDKSGDTTEAAREGDYRQPEHPQRPNHGKAGNRPSERDRQVMRWRQAACRRDYADAGRNGNAEEQPDGQPQRERHQGVGKFVRGDDDEDCGDSGHGSDHRSFWTIVLHRSSRLRLSTD
jgi:hypothetical protein